MEVLGCLGVLRILESLDALIHLGGRRAAGANRELRAEGKATLPSLLADELKANPFLTAPDVASFADRRARKDRF